MKKAIYFDMDGTLANLFGVKGFSAMLAAHDTTPYAIAKPMYDVEEMATEIARLKALGYTIGIISYAEGKEEKAYNRIVRKVKVEWLKKYFPFADEIHVVNKDVPKAKAAKIKNAILVDDARKNREAWNLGKTIDAYKGHCPNGLVAELAKITA